MKEGVNTKAGRLAEEPVSLSLCLDLGLSFALDRRISVLLQWQSYFWESIILPVSIPEV